MQTRSSDTHPDAERVQLELLRRMPPWRKLEPDDGDLLERDLAEAGTVDQQLAHQGKSRRSAPGGGQEGVGRAPSTLSLCAADEGQV
jgi:hypothetical protein